MNLIVRKTGTIFDFCESSDGIEYDGMIYGGSSVKLSYTNDSLKVIVDGGESKEYALSQLNYDDGSEIIGFATMLEFIDAVKTAGFTGNFNSAGTSAQYSETEQVIGKWINDKPIYQKTKKILNADLPETELLLSTYFNNIDELCPNCSIFTDWTGENSQKFYGFTCLTINAVLTKEKLFYYQTFDDAIYSMNLFDSVTLTLNYTKTTD